MSDIDPDLDLGRCCACGRTGPTVRNLLSLDRRAPVPGTGWGCFVCHLPSDGAIAVLCDACVEAGREPTSACRGYVADKGRAPAWELPPGVFAHLPAFHPELRGEQPKGGGS